MKHLTALDLLVVDPKHHYRGAGSKLVKWGVELADQMNAEVLSRPRAWRAMQ